MGRRPEAGRLPQRWELVAILLRSRLLSQEGAELQCGWEGGGGTEGVETPPEAREGRGNAAAVSLQRWAARRRVLLERYSRVGAGWAASWVRQGFGLCQTVRKGRDEQRR